MTGLKPAREIARPDRELGMHAARPVDQSRGEETALRLLGVALPGRWGPARGLEPSGHRRPTGARQPQLARAPKWPEPPFGARGGEYAECQLVELGSRRAIELREHGRRVHTPEADLAESQRRDLKARKRGADECRRKGRTSGKQ